MHSVRNPYDGSDVGQVALADAAALDRAAETAHGAFDAARKLQPFERSRILSNAAARLAERKAEFADTIVAEAGKPITLAEAEVDRAINTLSGAAEEARHGAQGEWLDLDAFPPGKGHIGFARRFPLGVIYGIGPFNFPLNLVLHKVAPAIATGNSIIIKPSPRTPLSAMKIATLLNDCGCPPGMVQVVICSNELAGRLIENERIKMVSFTGSAPVGWQIKRQAAMKRVTLELGGNAALIVHDDADLEAAVAAGASGAFSYAGQSCISVQRILVHSGVYDRFREMIVNHVRSRIRTGDPRDRAVLVGPMIDSDAMRRVRSLIDQAIRNGAKVLCGNEVDGPCLLPTLLEDADPRSPICASEVFAPVATLHRCDTFDHAIAMANDSIYGLQAGVFTRDVGRAWRAFEALEVGGVMINQVPTWRVETMPYGGVKQSGFGREGIRYAMQEMTEPRVLVMRIQ